MNIACWIIWGVVLSIFIMQIPLFFHRDPSVGRPARRFAFLLDIGIVVTAFTNISKLHLLWWTPVVFLTVVQPEKMAHLVHYFLGQTLSEFWP